MLPGIGGVSGLVSAPDPFVSYSEATNVGPTTTLVINKPSGVQSGFFLVALLSSTSASALTWTGDSGFTEVFDEAAAPNLRLAYLVAGAAEPSSYTFTISGSTGVLGQILCFRGYGYDTIGNQVPLAGNGSLVIDALTSAGGILIGATASRGGSSTPTHTTPTGMTLVKSTTLASAHALTTWYQFVGAGSTGTRTTTVAGAPTNSDGILMGLK